MELINYEEILSRIVTKIIKLPTWSIGETVCQPKAKGGLGIKITNTINQAVIAKTGWRLRSKGNSLWARMIKAKHNKGSDLIPHSPRAPKMLLLLGELSIMVLIWLRMALKKRIGNGKNILTTGLTLGDSKATWTVSNKEELVVNYLGPNGWNMDKLKGCLSWRVVQEICEVYASSSCEIKDRDCWRFTTNRDFSMKTVYRSILDQDNF